MGKFIRALARTQDAALAAQGPLAVGPDGRPLPLPLPLPPPGEHQQGQQQGQQQVLDPTQLDFCRVLYDFSPETAATGGQATAGIDIAVAKGDLVAVLSKCDPVGQPSEWWRCRARDGRVGYLPGVFLEVVRRRPREIEVMGGEELGGVKGGVGVAGLGKVGDISVESFQKGTFYS